MSVESPCIRVCTLDESGVLCLGCFRTIEEIGLWSGLADAARLRVIEQAGQRRRAHDANAVPARGSFCEACGEEFACGANDASKPCWCTAYPPVEPAGPLARCLCPACLGAASVRQGSHG